jgi:hypothetical protein
MMNYQSLIDEIKRHLDLARSAQDYSKKLLKELLPEDTKIIFKRMNMKNEYPARLMFKAIILKL